MVELDGSEAECVQRFAEVVAICEGAAPTRSAWPATRPSASSSGGAQGGVRGDGADRPQLLRAGQRDPAHAPARGAGRDRRARSPATAFRVANVFHAGDGNLHPLVCYDGRNEGEAERAEELAGLIVKVCVDAGGSITGEHGVGVDKKRYMPQMFTEADLGAFQRLRCAFDPDQLANPGKVLPTPRLCGRCRPLPPASARAGGRGRALVSDDHHRPGGQHARVARAARRGASAPRARPAGRCAFAGREPNSPGRGPPRSASRSPPPPLDRVVEHNAGDLTAVIEAGVPLARAQATFAEQGQMLALDPPASTATVGGVDGDGGLRSAANAVRRRARSRDRGEGGAVGRHDRQGGGKVIKNVAGYDLAKLFAGSFGTLGAILEVSVRLHPLPAATATALGSSSDPHALGPRRPPVGARSARAAGLDVGWSGGEGAVLARFGGVTPRTQAQAAERLLATAGMRTEIVDDDEGLVAGAARRQRSVRPVAARVGAADRAPHLLRPAERHGAELVGRAGLGLSGWLRDPRRTEGGPRPCAAEHAPPMRRVGCRPTLRRTRPGDRPVGPSRVRPGRRRTDAAGQAALRPGRHLPGASRPASVHRLRHPRPAARADRRLRPLRLLPAHLPHLPLWGEEMDSPRGRIVLMKQGHEGEIRATRRAPRPLPGLHGLRHRLPVRRPVRQADRGRPRPGGAQLPAQPPAIAPTGDSSSSCSRGPAACAPGTRAECGSPARARDRRRKRACASGWRPSSRPDRLADLHTGARFAPRGCRRSLRCTR